MKINLANAEKVALGIEKESVEFVMMRVKGDPKLSIFC